MEKDERTCYLYLANELENTGEKIFWVNQNKNIFLGFENQNHLFFLQNRKKKKRHFETVFTTFFFFSQ